jgi:effector-binding domain-containing protein
MSDYEVVIKRVEPLKVASARGIVPAPAEQGLLWQKLTSHLQGQNVTPTGPGFAIYHDDVAKEQDWDIEVCLPVATDLAETGDVRVRQVEGIETMATAVHEGPWATVGDAYRAIEEWVRTNGYQIAGPCREISLRMGAPESDPARLAAGIFADQADPSTVAEVQFPVRKP